MISDNAVVRDERMRAVGTVAVTSEEMLEAVRRGVDGFGSVPGNLLFRGLVHRASDAWNGNAHDPRRVAFIGGWSGLLDELKISQKDHTLVKEIATAGQCLQWKTPHAMGGGLWTWSERRGTRAMLGEVVFVLGDALAPGYGAELARSGNSTGARLARRLVPELRYAPPMGRARSRDHGRIWTLHRLLLVELVDHAEDLHAKGGVVITAGRWQELGHQARLSSRVVSMTLDAWVDGDSESAPALLERCGDADRWTLATPHAPERDFIAAGGKRRRDGRAGRAHSSRRQARR